MPARDVFISYSHRDEEYKDQLLRHLRVLEKQNLATFWDTSHIPAGADWAAEIKKAIDDAEVAVLLVSPDFLASEYVVDQELPALISRAKSRKTLVLPVLVRPCSWIAIPELAQFQFLNDVRSPISASEHRDQEFATIAEKIADLVMANRKRSESSTPQLDEDSDATSESIGKRDVFLSHSKHDGDFAELSKFRLEKAGISAWIDNDRLEPGIDWRQEIDDAIKQSCAVIAIMSPEARESEYVTYEWAFAWGAGVPVIPIMLRETPLHPRLAALHYLDFTNRRARPWGRLIESIPQKG